MWHGLEERGVSRVIVVGVFLHRPTELDWVQRAIPSADVSLVQLRASVEALTARVTKRELGSGRDDQMARTLRQLRELTEEDETNVHVVTTDGRSVSDIAVEVLHAVSWHTVEAVEN